MTGKSKGSLREYDQTMEITITNHVEKEGDK